ncbi:P-loop nucleoside triphosphate hydrolase superfamily protein with CH (Calponin Homology) domain [Zea mays]|uniref:Kinesin-like protein n=3 Tax=Zea mays TaxID=4577 RepID=A0A1D6MJR9_MAIZE|nr:P-loop nucleoside triphosphate hydrolase superfamily protein with CH (Calponin Homology) domain [Zea mays]
MTEPRRVSFRDGCLASRKAEEAGTDLTHLPSLALSAFDRFTHRFRFCHCDSAIFILLTLLPSSLQAWRRHQAAAWLQAMVGSLGLPPYPSEQEFVASLRNGIVLCKAINKLQPGAVTKIITNAPSNSQPLTAFQYFENIRNFLVAVNKLKLTSFEASDLDKDNLDAGTVGKIVDCVISLKSYHEWKQAGGANGPNKYMKSPLAVRSSQIQSENVASGPSPSLKRLDLTEVDADTQTFQNLDPNMKDCAFADAVEKLQKVIVDSMLSSKENIDQDILKKVPSKLIGAVLASQLGKEQHPNSPIESKQLLLQAHETELLDLKKMFQDVKVNFRSLQTQFRDDMAKLGENIQDLSKAALGYNQAVKENRNLYNMLQELRGNIRVFCRIRPLLHSESISSIEHVGTDGSVMVCDPVKPQSAHKIFQFNKVFGPTTTQDEVYKETQPLVRSVMDGYNVCIFAYGQTGSGKTHTMCGPSGGLSKDYGINYMALNDLFNISTSREDVKYDIRVQMVEIYNEQVRDLLNEDRSSTKYPFTPYILFFILTVHVNGKDIAGNVSRSSLHLVDLAGSERVDRSEKLAFLQVDTLKKALASKELEKTTLKVKGSATTSERTKQVLDCTPPRPRRLSLENASDKARMPERKILKSPRSAVGITHDKECNTDAFRHANHHESLIQVHLALSIFHIIQCCGS